MLRQKSWSYLVLFKDGGHKMSPGFYLFASDLDQGNGGGWMGSRFSCEVAGMERLSLDLLRAVKNKVGCGSVWNLQSR